MSDEEKKAIEYLRKYILPYYGGKGTIEFMLNDVLLNLIEKQSKEIEELKKYKKYYEEMEEVNKKFISVDKIKAKIEELKNTHNGDDFNLTNVIMILQSLLEKE